MLKINLQAVKNVLKEYELSSSDRNSIAKNLREEIIQNFYANLTQLANQRLKSSKGIYINSIGVTSNTVTLYGFLPNAVEKGMSPFDMKLGFGNSQKIKFNKKGGWYLTVPFRIGTPNSSGIYMPVMPRQIYNAVRAGKSYSTKEYTATTRPEVSNGKQVWGAYTAKTSIFSGIKQNYNPQTGKSTYNTFRRVGINSESNAFIHPGIKAKNLFDEAWKQTDISAIIDNAINSML